MPIPIRLRTEWTTRTQTTGAPRYTPHAVWTLHVHVEADVPVRIVTTAEDADEMAWGFFGNSKHDSAAAAHDIGLRFAPQGWKDDDDQVAVTTWNLTVWVQDRGLLECAPEHTRLMAPATAMTGEPISICTVQNDSITFALVALDARDTEGRRGARWALRRDRLDRVPDHLRVIADGPQRGTIRLTDRSED